MAMRPRPDPAREASRSAAGGLHLDVRVGDLRDSSGAGVWGRTSSGTPAIGDILAEFITRWQRGEHPRAEEYLDRLPPDEPKEALELIYQEFCLAESAGLNPDPAEYLSRFPSRGASLSRLFRLHDALDSADLRRWTAPAELPSAGDEIGPYALERELGRGAFARVFLARQADLDDRLVVVKVSRKLTPEPRLLARARHPHIVEVLHHGTIDDGAFQLICLPFLGGATLAAVLAGQGGRARRPRTGRDLLADLDRVAAPEYPAAHRSRPSRELLAALSYPKAVAWLIARLAEALGHAFDRGVAHGDIKPSNVLLTADGVPMLLDFNLAVGWQYRRANDPIEDAGGTLAYMAPERLEAIARRDPSPPPRAADRHRADIYALGVVLLETLTGRPPDGPRAAELPTTRRHGFRTVPPGLRPILRRCLEPHPADRYRHASELADDLDRWRNDLPPAHAPEPFWHLGLLRGVRRRRLALAAGLLGLAAAAAGYEWQASRAAARRSAETSLARYWDRADSGAFRFRRFDRWRTVEPGDPAEVAWGHLAHFGLDRPDDWRLREDVRSLPPDLREELEVWVTEQALRYGHALGGRPNAPDDWRRALAVLERVEEWAPLGPIAAQCRRLRQRLGLPDPPAPAGASPPLRWAEDYLRGVLAELDQRPAPVVFLHYARALDQRPRSFWALYRTAAVLYRLGNYQAAADHLAACLEQRPGSPALYVQLAGCHYEAGHFGEALAACDKALALDRDLAEAYLSRSFVRRRMGQDEARDADLRQFERLARRQGKASPGKLQLDALFSPRFNGVFDPAVWGSDLPRRVLAVDPDDVDAHILLATQLMQVGWGQRPPSACGPILAATLLSEGAFADLAYQLALEAVREQALGELDRVLELSPDHPWALYFRAVQLGRLNRQGADADLDRLLEHPRLEEFLGEYPPALFAFSIRSWSYLAEHDVANALRVAAEGMEAADRFQKYQAESHFALARVFAVAARSAAHRNDLSLYLGLLRASSEHLNKAATYPSSFDLYRQFQRDPAFHGVRGELRFEVGI